MVIFSFFNVLIFASVYVSPISFDDGCPQFYCSELLKNAKVDEDNRGFSKLQITRVGNNISEYSFNNYDLQKMQMLTLNSSDRNYVFTAYEKEDMPYPFTITEGDYKEGFTLVKTKSVVLNDSFSYFDMPLLAGSHSIRNSPLEIEITKTTADKLLSAFGASGAGYDYLIGKKIEGQLQRGGGDSISSSSTITAVLSEHGSGWNSLKRYFGENIIFASESFNTMYKESLFFISGLNSHNVLETCERIVDLFISESKIYGGFRIGYNSKISIYKQSDKGDTLLLDDNSSNLINESLSKHVSFYHPMLSAISVVVIVASLFAKSKIKIHTSSDARCNKTMKAFLFSLFASFSFLVFALIASKTSIIMFLTGMPSNLVGSISSFIIVMTFFASLVLDVLFSVYFPYKSKRKSGRFNLKSSIYKI